MITANRAVSNVERLLAYRLLAAEHEKLREIAARLEARCPRLKEGEPCAECPGEALRECAFLASEMLFELLNFSLADTQHEERIMKRLRLPSELVQQFGDHIEDHANLTTELTRLAGLPVSLPPSVTIEGLVRLTDRWLVEHHARFDAELTELLKRACNDCRSFGQELPVPR